jgi:thiol-disulfide isomerase/thioredoxin
MKSGVILALVAAWLCWPAAGWQSAPEAQEPPPARPADAKPAAPAKPAARETPPDVKVFNEANRLTDPDKKIEALEKWRKDYPESSMRQMAAQSILSTLVQKHPEQTDRIRQLARAMYGEAPERSRDATGNQIAGQFLEGNILLKEAQAYARKSVQSMRLESYLKDQQASFERRKQKPPFTADLEKRFRQSRASRVATLGRIEVKLGHTREGRRLLEEARAASPDNAVVLGALGELAADAGDYAKAMDFLVPARLAGNAGKSANAALETVYRKTHNGSADGLEAMLDGEYRKRFPNPVHTEAYKPTAERSRRLVLAEVFTGSGCPPCAGADVAFDAAMERYSRKDLAVVMYHVHVPRPDPMTTTDNQARYTSYSVAGVPTFLIDGKKTVGGGPRNYAQEVFDRFDTDIRKDLEMPAEARVTVEASLTGNSVKVAAAVDGIAGDSEDLKLQIALVEKELRYNGENGVRFHPMVVRAMGGEKGEGFPLSHAAAHFEQTFDLDAVSRAIKAHLDDYEAKGHRGESFQFAEKKYQIDRGNLAVVAFVQDAKSKHVLQAAWVDLGSGGGAHPATSEAR